MATGQTYSLKTVLSAVDNLSPVLQNVRKSLKTVDRSFSNVTRSAGELATKLAIPLTALAGAGAFSIQNSVLSFTALADSIDKAAIRAGVGTTALQSLRFAAELGGMTTEQMDSALAKLSYTMGQAASGGNKNLLILFKQLGIEIEGANGKVRNSAAVMRELAEAVKKHENTSTRLQILTAAFGDDLAKMLIPVLQDGAAGLDAAAKKARELGIVISDQDIKAGTKLTDTFSIFNKVIASVNASIGARLSPTLIQLTEHIQAGIVANHDLIATRVDVFVTQFANAIERIDIGRVINGVFDFAEGAAKVIDALGGIDTILKVVGATFAANIGLKVINLGKEIFDLAKSVGVLGKAFWALGGPWVKIIGLIGSGIAWIVTDFDGFIEKVKWLADKLTGMFSSFGSLFFGTPSVAPLTVPSGADGVNGRVDGQVTVRVVSGDGTRATIEDLDSSNGNVVAEQVGGYNYLDTD